MNQLSEHFSLDEFIFSETAQRKGIDNTPGAEELQNLHELALEMERVRELLDGYPIRITSAYRSPKVNAAVGGATNSAHIKGMACDFTCPGFGNNLEVARTLYLSGLHYDQLILEYGWVHIGFPEVGQAPRRQTMTKRSAKGPYENGLVA